MTYNYREAVVIAKYEVARQMERAADPSNKTVLCIPLLLAGVGTGKTDMVSDIASEFELPVISINCGESGDATDITGFPDITGIQVEEKQKYILWVMNEAVHRACMAPHILFFDDIDKIPALVEGALIGLFGKREIKGRKLHPKTILIAAGNRVHDDQLARQLSESIRTRVTPIEIETTMKDFVEYAERTKKVHPAVLGYLSYRPSHLHNHDPAALRFPTPRGWVEASDPMFSTPDGKSLFGRKTNDAWRTYVSLKCGDATGTDFWTWYLIVRNVDVAELLSSGKLIYTGESKDETMIQYAAVFAVAQELNVKGVKASYKGLAVFLNSLQLHPEMRVAMLVQLTKKTRDAIGSKLPELADLLLRDIIRSEDE